MNQPSEQSKLKSLAPFLLFAALALSVPFARSMETWTVWVSVFSVASGLWLIGWRMAVRGAFSVREVLVWGLVFRVALLPMGPTLSDDYFRYLWDGWLQVEGISPFAFVPEDPALAAFQDSVLFEEMNSPGYFSIYPPLSQVLFAGAALFLPLGWEVSYYVLKTAMALIEAGGLVLMSRLVSAKRLVVYAWCPLVALETAGQGHGEAMMLGFLVLMLWAVQAGRGRLAVAALAGATLVKLIPLVLFPFLFNRVGWKRVPLAAGIGAAFTLPYLLWAPGLPESLANIRSSTDLYVQNFEFNAGVYFALKELVGTLTEIPRPGYTVGPWLRAVFVVGWGLAWFVDTYTRWAGGQVGRWAGLQLMGHDKAAPPTNPPAHLPTIAYLIFGLYLLCTPTIHPWYFLFVLVFVPFLARVPAGWIWLVLAAPATYLRYSSGEEAYWLVVWVGWAGWAVLTLGQWALRRLTGEGGSVNIE
ncbi:MAG: hypothetical protein AAF752_04885 [Bacteroidota bacterium]